MLCVRKIIKKVKYCIFVDGGINQSMAWSLWYCGRCAASVCMRREVQHYSATMLNPKGAHTTRFCSKKKFDPLLDELDSSLTLVTHRLRTTSIENNVYVCASKQIKLISISTGRRSVCFRILYHTRRTPILHINILIILHFSYA